MKLYLLIFVSLIFSSKSKEENQVMSKRLTYKESFDPNNIYYILDSQEEFKQIKNLQKNEIYKNSSSYSYEWSNHTKKTSIDLKNYLPQSNSEGYRDMTKYEYIYLNIFSKRNTGSKIVLLLYCQERTPDSVSAMKVAYKSYIININFVGWKEIKVPLRIMSNSYGADLTKVSGFSFSATGWNCIPKEETEIYIDKIYFSRYLYTFNMKEFEIYEENYLNILKKLKYSLLNNNRIINEDNQNIIKKLKSIVKTAIKTRDSINRNGLPFNSPMQCSEDMNSIYTKIKQMAMGYAVEGGELYKNKELLNDIVYSLDYMNDNYYTKKNQKIFTGFDNWWNWDIGIPQALVQTLVLIKDELTAEQINKYLSPLNEYIPLPSMTMANRADIAYSCIIAGALQKDYKRIALSVEMLRECFDYVEEGDGFYDDGSFIQHNVYAYIGGYGSSLINAFSILTYILEDTCFRFDDEMREKQSNWIINSFIPFLYDGAFFDLVRGRGVDRNSKGQSTGIAVINSFFFALKYIKNEKNLKFLKNYLKNLYLKYQSFYDSSLSIGVLSILEELISDDIQVSENSTNFAKVYSRMDKAIAQFNDIGIGISLSSSRQGKYESINEENKKGWYQGDGMTYIYLKPEDYSSSYWPYVNLYRLPGTTVTKAPRQPSGLSGIKALTEFDFVGGTYLDSNMIAVMQFGSKSPGANFNSSLIGNKAYFILDNILVCIGNNISCNDEYGVETIIENRKINGKFYFGDKEILEHSGKVTSNYIYIENYGGIYIPDYSNVYYNLTNDGFLEIYFNHGKKIKNASYKYFIIPKVDKNSLISLSNNIHIISDYNKVTAIKNKANNITEYVFWEKGKLGEIEVDNPCTIIFSNNKELYVSDPSQKLANINISFGNNKYKVNLNKGYPSKIVLKNNLQINRSIWIQNLLRELY